MGKVGKGMKRPVQSVVVILLVVVLIFSSSVFPVSAYKSGSGSTHEFIFNQANMILRNDGWVSLSDFLTSVDPVDPSGRTYLQVLVAGSDDNDVLIPLPWELDRGSMNHYMDPTDHHRLEYGGIGWKSAGVLCQERFLEAFSHWVSGARHDAMYDLGWAAHLVQDICVPHHAYPTWQSGHSNYEDWVETNKYSYAVNSGGIYEFSPFPDLSYYSPTHYDGGRLVDPFFWVDFNAHESIKYWGSVNYFQSGVATNDYFVETVHDLPNGISTTWVVTDTKASQIRIHFSNIKMEQNWDYVKIYDQNDNPIASYTGDQSNVWTPWVFGNTLKIKTTTDASWQSWGFRTDSVEFYDVGGDLEGATAALLSRAQRTTAGFVKLFFDLVDFPIRITQDGFVDPPGAGIVRNGDLYTLTENLLGTVEIEKDDIIIDGNGYDLNPTYLSYGLADGVHLFDRHNVTIQNLTVSESSSGVFVASSTGIVLRQNTLSQNGNGIRILSSSGCNFSGNTLNENTGNGVVLENSSNNILSRNTLCENSYGINLESSSDYNTIERNNISSNHGGGVYCLYSDYTQIVRNDIMENYGPGISCKSNHTLIKDNNVTGNSGNGVELKGWFAWQGGIPTIFHVAFNEITTNHIVENSNAGTLLLYATENVITDNTIVRNQYGISISAASNNFLWHNNLLDNTHHVNIDSSTEVWDNGYPSGGNFWSSYNGIDVYGGIYQNELGSDGLGDQPYYVNSNNTDLYPLMNVWPIDDVPPDIAVFSPQNLTYDVSSVPLSYRVDRRYSWSGYSLDGGAPVTVPTNYSSFKYRRSHIVNSAVGAGEGYQIKIVAWRTTGTDSGENAYFGTKCRPDFGDIRFASSTKSLNYWLESYDAVKATFWVKLDGNLSESSQTIYIYYGNDDLTTSSNFDDTFIFGDPFDTTSLDSNRWTSVTGNPVYRIDEVNHYLEVTSMDSYHWMDGSGFTSKSITVPSTWIVEDAYGDGGFRFLHTSVIISEMFGQRFCLRNSTSNIATSSVWDAWAADLHIVDYASIGSDLWTMGDQSVPLPYITSWTIKRASNGNITLTQNGTDRIERPNSDTVDRLLWETSRYQSYGFGTERLYAFRIRKYVTPEPIHGSWGAEEPLGISTATLSGLDEGNHSLTVYARDYSGNVGESTVNFAIDLINDVAVVGIEMPDSIVVSGDTISINATVENHGETTESFDVELYANETLVGTQRVEDLPSGSFSVVSFVWNTNGFPTGNYTLTAQVNPVPGEIDLADNVLTTGTLTLGFHDVAITDIICTEQNPEPCHDLTIYVTLENNGYFSETFTVDFTFRANLRGSTERTSSQITTLLPGETLTLNFTVTPTRYCVYTINAHTSLVERDVNLSNNSKDLSFSVMLCHGPFYTWYGMEYWIFWCGEHPCRIIL